MRKQLQVLKELQGDLSLIETPNYKKLISCIDKILESNTTDGELYYQKGVIFFQKDDYQQAIEYFRKALNCDAKNNTIIQNLGISYKAVGNFQAALEQFNKSLEIQPKNTQVAILKGDTLRLMKRFTEAETIFQDLHKKDRDNVNVIQGLIELKLDQDLKSEAIQYIEQIESLKVIEVDPLLLIAQRLVQSKLDKQALKILSKILAYDNKNTDGWYSQGIILYNGDQFTEALKSFEKVIELDPQNTSAMLYLALSFGQLNRYQDAIQIFGKLLQINPKDAAIWNNKGIACRELKQYQQALVCFDKALEINPTNPLYKINKALIMIEINKPEGLKLLQKAKESFNSDIQLLNNQVFTSVNIQYMQLQFQLLEQNGDEHDLLNQIENLENIENIETKDLEGKRLIINTNDLNHKDFGKLKNSERKNTERSVQKQLVRIPTEEVQSEILNQQEQKKDLNVSFIQQSCLIQGSNSDLMQIENTLIGGQQGSIKKRNTKFKIDQLENMYQQLRQKINTIEQQIQLVGLDKRAAIYKQLQEFQKSAEGLNQLAYYKAFFWTLFNYIQSYANQSTGLFQHNTNQTIETPAEKVADNLETGLAIGVKISASIPLINTVLSTVHSAVHTLFQIHKDNKHQDRIEAINEIISKKVIGLSDLELQISSAALDLSIKKLDIIKDLETVERKKSKTLTQEMEKIIRRMMESKSSLYQGGASQIGLEDALNCLGYYYQNGLIDEDQELSQQIVLIIIEKRYFQKTPIVESRECFSCSCQIQ
ncbi:unnamed protein product (macronuclear) [Paramecium tetraurelia]|uniref:Uncharacterized protein n=1 Tax=Paramecium tetraurelia TaxID=5888 RepID=A0DN75_PARTE|nr:uncharacterized protein GSPATT00018697001 [Paramecium tetraurelia]CAK84492.1 unnamed protein product [Paramecium tetraurelia]|eukprot:XP_001451889.1 hypothetical protein (macronuclear) [Paramecium tetraurelia strain d4-2]